MSAEPLSDPTRLLGGLAPDAFVRDYWQKRPLLVRGAVPGGVAEPSPEQLAGLACEADVVSRIVLEDDAWEVRHGPFDPREFEQLPERGWSLLVQEVDRWLPGVADLRDRFRFLPSWRFDDVMVSYAAPGGNVGAHVDRYDVFLVQGRGRRRWSIRREPLRNERCIPGLELGVLAEFEPDEEWVVEPGDLLYLPPRVAHHGVALEPATTLSVGFRAPHRRELLSGLAALLPEDHGPHAFYGDADLVPEREGGRVDRATLDRVRRVVACAMEDDAALAEAFGRLVTEPQREPPEGVDTGPCTDAGGVAAALESDTTLERSAPGHFAWFEGGADGAPALFVGGESYGLTGRTRGIARVLCSAEPLDRRTLGARARSSEACALLATLVRRGYLVPERNERS